MPPNQTTAVVVAQDHPNWVPMSHAIEQRLPSIRSFLGGSDVAADRFRRVVLQSVVRNPDLLNASPDSLASAAAEAAMLGLEPSGAVGGAHLVRYADKVQLIADYRGLIELARRSEQIEDVWADVVREADVFTADRGLNPTLTHEPDYEAPRTPNPDEQGNRVVHVYAVALFRSGHRRFEVMSREEVDAIRARSRAANNGPWRTDYMPMALKTVLRRLCKTLPLHPIAREQLAREDEIETQPEPPATAPTNGAGSSVAERLRQRREANEQPSGGSTAGEASGGVPAGAPDGAVPAAAEQGGDAGTEQATQRAPEPEAAASPPGGGSPVPDEAGDSPGPKPDDTQPGTIDPASSPPAASTYDELQRAPSTDTFLAYAKEILGIEANAPVALKDLTPADGQQVLAAIGEAWADLRPRLPAAVKANARAWTETPKPARGRQPRPTAEELREAVQTEAGV